MTPRRDENDASRWGSAAADASPVGTAPTYEPPSLTVLGSLAELTRGGSVGAASDGFGTAGASGALP
jgi:hypothetical protein